MRAFLVYNPAANHGRTGQDWPALAAALQTVFPRFAVTPLSARGQAARLVRDALREGHDQIVVVGGDGTVNEAVNGFFEQGAPLSPDAVLNIVQTGARNDIAHGRPSGVPAALALRNAPVRPRDLGHVSCLTAEGRPVTRFFLNAASFGITGDAARRLNQARISALFGPNFARDVSEAMALAAWRTTRVRLVADNGFDEIDGISAVAVLNGTGFGGGLMVAPDAEPGDGRFDIAILGGDRKRRIREMFRRLQRGEKVAVRRRRSTRLTAAPTVETRQRVIVETDGEALGMLPASFEIVSNAIRVRL
jgi:diacylglycerol kinase family enzyme